MAVVAPPLASWRARWDAGSDAARTVLLVAGVAVAVFGLVVAAVSLTTAGAQAASWFPAAGVSVGAVAVSRGHRRYAFLVAIGLASLAGFVVGGRSLSLAICFAAACTLEAAVAGYWLSRGERLRLATLGDLGRFLMITGVAASIAGAIDGAAVWHFVGTQAAQTWLIVTVAHATGALVLLPFVMRVPPHSTSLRLRETGRAVGGGPCPHGGRLHPVPTTAADLHRHRGPGVDGPAPGRAGRVAAVAGRQRCGHAADRAQPGTVRGSVRGQHPSGSADVPARQHGARAGLDRVGHAAPDCAGPACRPASASSTSWSRRWTSASWPWTPTAQRCC